MDAFDRSCKVIKEVYNRLKNNKMGKMPTYIPHLSKTNASTFSISFVTVKGQVFSIGDSKTEITIQSISKVLALASALEKIGLARVLREVGIGGNPFPFNSLVGAVVTPGKTISPFTNQGAIAITSKLYTNPQSKYEAAVMKGISRFASRPLKVSRGRAKSELDANITNRALAWILASYGKLDGNVDDVLKAYVKQCSILVNSVDIATMAAVFAADGVNPVTGERIIPKHIAVHTTWALQSVALPNSEQLWDLKVGSTPAKSGVSGGLFIIIPGVGGLGIVSPPLNSAFVSAKGLAAAVPITRQITSIYMDNFRWLKPLPRRSDNKTRRYKTNHSKRRRRGKKSSSRTSRTRRSQS